jgi:hypothetical protein
LRHSAEGHHQFAESAAVDIRNVFEVQQNLCVPFRNLIANRLSQSSERVAGRNFTRDIQDYNRIGPSAC